jgi:lysophospholipase L1-like esterase
MKQSTIRVALWAVLSLVTLEASARVDDWITYDAPILEPYNMSRLFIEDHNGTRGKPGASYLKWKLNAQGFRGPLAESQRVRILCLGASETFGLYESEGMEFPRQLEVELNRRLGREDVSVVNAATPGMSTHAAIRRIPDLVELARPDFILVYPSLAVYIDLGFLTEADRSAPRQEFGRPFDFEFRIQRRAEVLVKSIIPDWVQTQVRLLQIRLDENSQDAQDRLPEANILAFRNDLVALIRAIEARGVSAVLLTHATRFGNTSSPPERNSLTAWRKFYPSLREEGFLDMESRMNAVIRDVARTDSVSIIDMADEMPGGSNYFADFVHFTDSGARVFAARVAEKMAPMVTESSAHQALPNAVPAKKQSEPLKAGAGE